MTTEPTKALEKGMRIRITEDSPERVGEKGVLNRIDDYGTAYVTLGEGVSAECWSCPMEHLSRLPDDEPQGEPADPADRAQDEAPQTEPGEVPAETDAGASDEADPQPA